MMQKRMQNWWRLTCLLLFMMAMGQALAAPRATREEAVAMVKKAVAYYKKHGKQQALPVFSELSGPFRDRELFLVVLDSNGNVLSHSGMHSLLRTNIMNLKDDNHVYMVRDMFNKAKKNKSGWSIEYTWFNPYAHRMEPKVSYFELHDGLLFFCGVYKA